MNCHETRRLVMVQRLFTEERARRRAFGRLPLLRMTPKYRYREWAVMYGGRKLRMWGPKGGEIDTEKPRYPTARVR